MQKRGQGMQDKHVEQLVNLFRLLSDETRLSIMMLLTQGERNVTSLCEELKLPQPTVSHHLGLLRMSNLISNRRNGKQVFYGLNGHIDATSNGAIRIQIERFDVTISDRR
jgi:ArsR family transcriptional regulator